MVGATLIYDPENSRRLPGGERSPRRGRKLGRIYARRRFPHREHRGFAGTDPGPGPGRIRRHAMGARGSSPLISSFSNRSLGATAFKKKNNKFSKKVLIIIFHFTK